MTQILIEDRIMENIALKFVEWDVPSLDTLKDTKVYQIKEKVVNKIPLNREEKDWVVKETMESAYFRNMGIVCLYGWAFDFSSAMKTFLVKQYEKWTEYKAFDKTSLRNNLYGRIERIVEA